MKQVIAIVKPYLAEKVLEALSRAPLEALNVREVKGFGKQKNYLDEYSESEYSQTFLPKVEISVWLDDARAEETIRKIVAVARTGRMGDGKIFVIPTMTADQAIDIAASRSESSAKSPKSSGAAGGKKSAKR
ncbi:MAG: P-II family nitrogen regulator [Pirellulaceae bacterium]